MKNIISILGWVFAVLALFALAIVMKHAQAPEQAIGKHTQTQTTKEKMGAPTIQKHIQQNANAQISTPQLFKIKKCGKVQDFETEAWAKDFFSKITNEYLVSEIKASYLLDKLPQEKQHEIEKQYPRNPTLPVREQEGKIRKEFIKEICVVENFKDRKQFLVALVSGAYCSFGSIFRYDIASGKLERVFYPETARCSGSLDGFKHKVTDGYMLPVIAAFGDAGVYGEYLYYYDLLHNALFYLKKTKTEYSNG